MTIFYCPLEGYKERYTMQWSAPKTGWLERRWIETGVDYKRIEPTSAAKERVIKKGCVLDAVGRSIHTFAQTEILLEMADAGKIDSNDVIYFDDFWHPGIEALPYAFHLLEIDPPPSMFAFLHAQSVDEFDFTHEMRHWMRFFERGIAAVLDGIFVCCPTLRDLVVHGGIADRDKVFITGHPFASDEVMERMPQYYQAWMKQQGTAMPMRQNHVIYSSRFDREKNPLFFLYVARKVLDIRKDIKFIVCTGSKELRSNMPEALRAFEMLSQQYPSNVMLRRDLSKEDYYRELVNAKVQMNTASQDFVAITLLESSVAGCYPVYPYFRSFPETFLGHTDYMYEHLNVDHAVAKIITAINLPDDTWSPEAIKSRAWIHNRFDISWKRMLVAMTGMEYFQKPLTLNEMDPYLKYVTKNRPAELGWKEKRLPGEHASVKDLPLP